MNLIANTGIHLLGYSFDINLKDNFKMYFHEWLDISDQQKKLEIAHYFPEEEIWIKKRILYGTELGYATFSNGYKVSDTWDTISKDDEFDSSCIIPIETENPSDSGCFEVSLSKIKDTDWSKFENVWLPLPYFQLNGKRTEFGPTNWCRFKLVFRGGTGQSKRYELVLAFDTRTVFKEEGFEDEDFQETPIFTNQSEHFKNYSLCNTEEGLIGFCSEEKNCGWIDKYLLKVFHGIDNISDKKIKMPKLEYLAKYIFLVRLIHQSNILPSIKLYSNLNAIYGDVDLVVDIGNSRTCAVLFDNSDFTKSSPLELQDFSSLISQGRLNKYRDSFDMRLAFREADFGGNFGLDNSDQFIYPSFIRLGSEANKLIHKATNMNVGAEKTSTFSSPKRYLWDDLPQKKEWEYVQFEGEVSKPIYIRGISDKLNEDGTFGEGSITNKYSRKSLMTFSFLEILAQANMQINSYEQRHRWGHEATPRKIKRIIVTCPTAMSRKEQAALRKCAEDASLLIDCFFSGENPTKGNEEYRYNRVQVLPDTKKLSSNIDCPDWIYDEATCAQFVFLYAEIKERYQKNVKDYFDFYGKFRLDLEDYDKKSITIGSVDIGAGTTDLMIAAYKYDDSNSRCTLTPEPIFWESFYFAGDDLVKRLILQLVIQGPFSPIEQKLKHNGKNPIEILQPFLGTDNGVSFRNRRLRNDFNLQVSLPVVLKFLQLLNDNHGDKILSYSDVFSTNPPSQPVLNHFRDSFGFELTDLQWTYKQKVISEIVEKTFDTLIGKISALLNFHSCDIVLLSGRPTSLKPISDLFLKYYSVSPNRLKSMNNYRVGRWYPQDLRHPFIDGNGKFINPKSIVTTGAIIGHLASKKSLNGFTLNLSALGKKFKPTTRYFGSLHPDTQAYLETIISPDMNSSELSINHLPVQIGTRQLDITSYPSRPFYLLDFNDIKIEDRVLGNLEVHEQTNDKIEFEIKTLKDRIRKAMPIRVTITRDFTADIEKLVLDEVVDRDGNTIPKGFFNLRIQSMCEIESYWLDSGIFSLNVSSSTN